MTPRPAWLLLLLSLGLSFGCGRDRRVEGDDDDDSTDGGPDLDAAFGIDGGADPCPGLFCCPGKECPVGHRCDDERGACVADACAGLDCCDERPCEDGLECLDGSCVPVSTIGEPCASEQTCNGPDATCLTVVDGWPDGYCTQSCVAGACPGDGVCVGGTCFDGCFVIGDCRPGYDCNDVPGGFACSPQ